MTFFEAVASCFRNYATFAGRARRSEYWHFVLFHVLGSAIAAILDAAIFRGDAGAPLNAVFSLATFLPFLAVAARRLHDIGRSGWWMLIWLLPLVGWIILLVWTVRRGEAAPNRFGPPVIPAPGGSQGGAWVSS